MIEASALSNIEAVFATTVAVGLVTIAANNYIYRKFETKVEDLAKDLRGEVKEVRDQVNEVKGELKEVKSQVKEVKGKVERIDGVLGGVITFLQTHLGKDVVPDFGNVSTGMSNSPCTLNKKGAELALQLDAYALVDKYYKTIPIPEDATKFHIQNACFLFAHAELQQRVNAEEREKIEEAIYEEDGNANNVIFVYSVLFRDKHLQEHGYPIPEYIAT